MKSEWLGSLKGQDREDFKNSVLASQIVLDKLREIVYNMHKKDNNSKLVDYDCPSWSHRQAHTNGRLEALSQILELLEFKDK